LAVAIKRRVRRYCGLCHTTHPPILANEPFDSLKSFPAKVV
jgi:hypothetical protein